VHAKLRGVHEVLQERRGIICESLNVCPKYKYKYNDLQRIFLEDCLYDFVSIRDNHEF
jgi:hypothetical protein